MAGEVEVNIAWTKSSMEDTKKHGEHIVGTCYACEKENKKIKVYVVAIKNPNMMWSDGQGPVWEKIKVQYCDRCAKDFMKSLKK